MVMQFRGERAPWGQAGGYQPWLSFRPSDLLACYPMPPPASGSVQLLFEVHGATEE